MFSKDKYILRWMIIILFIITYIWITILSRNLADLKRSYISTTNNTNGALNGLYKSNMSELGLFVHDNDMINVWKSPNYEKINLTIR